MSGQQYQITVFNNSGLRHVKAVVFQKDPALPNDMLSLAWFSKACNPNTQVQFTWTEEYNFVWGQTGILANRVNYNAGQVLSADLRNNNAVTLTSTDGGFEFTESTQNIYGMGSLIITEDASVPGAGSGERGNVGIGMGGVGTFVRATQPNARLQYTPSPTYYVALGAYNPGDVVSESELHVPTQVRFAGSTTATCEYTNGNFDVRYGT